MRLPQIYSAVFLFIFQICLSACAAGTSGRGLGGSLEGSNEYAKYAAPALPVDLSRQISRMLDVRGQGIGIMTDDARTIFYTWSITGRNQVWKLDRNIGYPVQMTGGEDPTYLRALFPNQKFIVVERDQGGEENPGIYIQSVRGGPLKKIFHKAKVQANFQRISDDGSFIYFTANDQNPENKTLYRFEVSNGQTTQLMSQPGYWAVSDAWENEKLLLAKYLGNSNVEYSELDLNTKKLKPLFGQGKSEEIEMMYGSGPNDYFVLTNMFGNFKRLYSMKEGSFNPVTEEMSHDVEGFHLDRSRSYLPLVINENGFIRFRLLDAKTLKNIELPKMEADDIVFGNFSWNSKFLTMSVETSDSPRNTYAIDLEKKTWIKLLVPSAPEVDTESFVEAQAETYSARDGTKIPILIRKPLACEEPCPVVIHFHGGPEGQSQPGFSTFSQIYVDAGFIFAEPNVRGSDGYGKEWLHSDDAAKRLQVITDIEDAALAMKEKFSSKGQAPKIGILGYSYGGYAALMGMTRFAGSFDAGVALVGPSNLLTFLNNTAPYRRALRVSEYGDPEKDKEALIQLSPVTYIDKLKGPLLLIQGANDPRVPATEAIQFYELARQKGQDTQLILFANEGHGSSQRANQVLEIGNSLQFFMKHLRK